MSYRQRVLVSPLVVAAALMAAAGAPARAADLYEGGNPPVAYEDRRYEEIYEYPPPRAEVGQYEERHYAVRERYVERRSGCLSPYEIERVLFEDGWRDIDDLEFEGHFVRVEANRVETDRDFDLVLDRCSGRIVEARPDDFRPVRHRGHWRHRY